MSCNCEGNTYKIGMGCCVPVVANADNYYTKSEIDEIIDDISVSGEGITLQEAQDLIDENLTDYYTKDETDGLLSNKLDASAYTPCDLSDYYNKSEVDNKLSDKANTSDLSALSGTVGQLSSDLANKADKSEIPSLSGYATEQWVEDKGYLTEHQHLKTINNISLVGDGDIQIGTGGTTDLSNYYTKGETNNLLDDKLDASAYTPTDLSNYATKQWVEDKHYLTEHQSLADYYNKSEVNSLLGDKLDASAYTPTDLSQYWTSAQTQSAITQSVSGYATEQWVQNQGYLTEHQSLSGYATTATTTNINNALTAHTASTTVHVTQNEKNTWNSKVDSSTLNNYMLKTQIWCGTQSEYDSIQTKDNNVIYLIHS